MKKRARITSYEVFKETMRDLESTLLVKHIATFELITCTIEDEPAAVLENHPIYDQFPVLDGDGNLESVLERVVSSENTELNDKYRYRPLNDAILISANEPLGGFLPLMAQPPYYRLVLLGPKVEGVVTRSDILKLPVRVLAFARIAHLETVLAGIIDRRYSEEDEWMARLNSRRQRTIREKKKQLAKKHSELPLLELTSFDDKVELVSDTFGLPPLFKEQLDGILKLRHKLAHAGDYANDNQGIGLFLDRLAWADRWIQELSELLHLSPKASEDAGSRE